jgi:hypothetical protein
MISSGNQNYHTCNKIEESKMLTINEALHKGTVWIKFTKKDGSVRVGTFTNNFSLIPESKSPKGTGAPSSPFTTRCFDVEKQEWRSFKNDSVIEWSEI